MQKQYKIPGKWILAGEHAVVRGHPALVFPLFSRTLSLSLTTQTASQFEFTITSSNEGLKQAATLAMKEALRILGDSAPTNLQLNIELTSTIPVGSGLGSSAALSVAIARVFHDLKILPEEKLFSFAHNLEDLFHGKSSGLDIAAVLLQKPICFIRGSEPRVLELAWKPELYLSDTGIRSRTKDCVLQVEAMKRPDLDEAMALAVRLAEAALTQKSGSALLTEALILAESCYEAWGLLPSEAQSLKYTLQRDGASAVKMTGSGQGGFLLSLWQKGPQAAAHLIPCF